MSENEKFPSSLEEAKQLVLNQTPEANHAAISVGFDAGARYVLVHYNKQDILNALAKEAGFELEH